MPHCSGCGSDEFGVDDQRRPPDPSAIAMDVCASATGEGITSATMTVLPRAAIAGSRPTSYTQSAADQSLSHAPVLRLNGR
ncbi:MAG: hypothetical protein U0470_06465 [Anaerolineae bacterium]